jgi:hypothetical protein
MEKYPDVRVYFWMVGDEVMRIGQGIHRPIELDPPTDLEERILYDDELVKKGGNIFRSLELGGRGISDFVYRIHMG